MRHHLFGIVVAALLVPACSPRIPVESLPDVDETMARVGRRLSQRYSVQELTALALRGDRVLAQLRSRERSALGRGALRFRVDRPVIVHVAAPSRSAPFWLDDLGFAREATPLRVGDSDWALFRKSYPAGWVGLGVNGLDRSPSAHYAVFVRPDGPGPPPTPRGIDPEHWRCSSAAEGMSAAFDHDLPIGPLPEELRGAVLLQAEHGRRHATLLVRDRAWKTHVVSGPTPDQVAVAFGADPARELVWTWRTDPDARPTLIRLAPARSGGDNPGPAGSPRTIRGDSDLVATPDLLNDPSIRRHQAAATDLAPDTAYVYSLGDGSPGGWTPWVKVRTGPDRPRSFRFLYVGDPQCGLESWGKLMATAHRRHPESAFLLIAGDLVDRGNERTNWDHFFLRAAGVFEGLPMLPCAGNHEYLDEGPRLYQSFFNLPRNGPEGIDPGLVYSFEYGNTFVAVLDSTSAITDAGMARKQAEWLDDRLSRTRATWKLAMFHHPIYVSHPTRETPLLREEWVPVFDKHHVDLVLQGHDHAYLRTHPLHASRRVERSDQGTTYVVSVSGTKYCDQRPRSETAVGFTGLSTYQTIDIEVPEARLSYRAWDADGREVDRLTIEKSVAPAQIASHPAQP